MPTKLCCDKCGREQVISEFVGIVIHFENEDNNDEECDGDCEHCTDSSTEELHFCNIKCMTDYMADPLLCDKIAKHDDKDVNIFASASETPAIIYALGRSEW